MIKLAHFLHGRLETNYVVVERREIPVVWAEYLKSGSGYFEEYGWDAGSEWCQQFFDDIRARNEIAMTREDTPAYNGISALWQIDDLETSSVLRFRLSRKICDLRGTSA